MKRTMMTFSAALVAAGLMAADPAAKTPEQVASDTAAALVKESCDCIKADPAKACDLRIRAIQVPNLTAASAKRLLSDAQWDFTVTLRDAAVGIRMCEAIAASPLASDDQKCGSLSWVAKSQAQQKAWAASRATYARLRAVPGVKPATVRGAWMAEAEGYVDERAADAEKNALAAYEKAFAIKDGGRREYDIAVMRAVEKLAKDYAEASRKLSDALLADKETTDEYRFNLLMRLVDRAKRDDKRDDLYKYALEAQKVPGKFDRRAAYYALATYEFEKRRWSLEPDPDQMKLYMKWMDAAYEAALKEMGLPQSEAAKTYLLVSEKIMWHMGRPDKDSKLARKYFEKAEALGVSTNGQHWGSYTAVRNRLLDLEEKEAEFATFPRDWRKEDGRFFAELEKRLDAGKTVHAKDFGWDKDDATAALQKAVDSDASVIVVDNMGSPWEIECLDVPPNKKIVLRKGAVIEAKNGGLLKSRSFILIGGFGIVIAGEGGNEIRMRKQDYMKDKKTYPEFDDNRHGIGWGKKPGGDLLVRNVKIHSTGGDGVCVTNARRIWFDRVELWNNLRQAMTLGTGAYKVYLTGCKFNYTWGMEPMSGIDIENWTENCAIGEIYCEDCEFADNRIYGLVLATSTYTPISMYYKNCEFRNNHSSSLSLLNRPGVPTVNREIFEGCRFLQARCVKPISYIRTLIGNVTFKDCLIKEIPGGDSSGTASPISIALDPDMSDFYVGRNVFDNVKIEGYADAELIAMLPRAPGTEYIKDGAFAGTVDFNGKKIDLAKYIKERGLDKVPPKYVPVAFDAAKLTPPPLDTSVDAYILGPYGSGLEMLYWAKKDRVIKLGFFNRVTSWTKWEKGRALRAIRPDGTTEVVGPMDYTNDYSTAYYTVPEDGFYRFTANGNGFWIPADDQAWGYSYRASGADGFANMGRTTFTGFFEVPAGLKEVTIQTKGGEGFELVDAGNVTLAKTGPTKELTTWTFPVKNPGVWRFRSLHGSIRFFAPLNGIFADQPANLPRMK